MGRRPARSLRKGGTVQRRKIVALLALSLSASCGHLAPHGARRLDDALPRPGLKRGLVLAVTARFTFEDSPEQQITLGSDTDGHVTIDVIEAVGRPLWRQIESGSTTLMTNSFHIDGTNDTTELLERLRRLRLSVIPANTLYIHPDTLTIWIETLGGEFQLMTLLPPSQGGSSWKSADQPQEDLVRWANDLRSHVTRMREKH